MNTRFLRLFALLLLAALHAGAWAQAAPGRLRFVFGAHAGPGETAVAPDARYSAALGHGFEGPGPGIGALAPVLAGPRRGAQALAPGEPQFFSVDLPEGAWRVTLTLGGTEQPSDTTVRAEVRRLVLQNVASAAREVREARFTVHVRTPRIPAGEGRAEGQVQLNGTREAVGEAWNWDGRLTLELNGARPVVQAIEIEPVQVPQLFLLGDSTVADQSAEPYASWGQMLPRFLGPGVAVVSLAQSGETYRDSLARRRLDKILSLAQRGDVVLMQFGHNDQKQIRAGTGSIATYQDEIRRHVRALQAAGLVPVVVSSVERRIVDTQGRLQHTLAEQVAAARAVASETGAAFLDLNAASRRFYEALGRERAPIAFARPADGKVDPTHHDNYGAWVLAGLVAQGLKDLKLPVAAHLRTDVALPRAEAPPTPQALAIRPSPGRANERPAGDTDAARPAAAGEPAYPPERLARLDRAVADEIAQGRLAGAVTLLWRDGKPVHVRAQGLADRENGVPMREDTMFRIASMSKAVTTVAAMMLYEEGRFLLRDPVAKHLPEFADVHVAVAAADGQPSKLEKPRRPLTVRDLLQHTAGLSYGSGPASTQWREAGFNDWYILGRDETLAEWTRRLAQLPLQGHPGEAFQYGYGTDVLGRLVEVWSGQPLDRFIAERITGPLRMPDTHFWVPREKAARLAPVYGLEKGQLVLKETSARSDFIDGPRKLVSGGAGLVSTVGDYARFLQMLLNRGTLDGVRLLSPATVDMLHRDHLGPRTTGDAEGGGFGFWIQKSPGTRSELGSEGAYGWGSAYVPQYVVDPQARTLFIFMAQLRPAGDSNINQRAKVLARQALVE